MSTALFSDMHGNGIALDVCLGDAVQGGAQPAEVLDRLAELACPVVLGNADAFLLDVDAGREAASQQLLEVREWTLSQLEPRDLDQIRRFEPLLELDLDGRTLLAFHGAPDDYDTIILPWTGEEELRNALGGRTADVYAGGHVHQQFLRRIGDGMFVNPGSVGLSWDWNQPHDDLRVDPFACYAIVGDGSVEFRRVGFDPAEVIGEATRRGRPNADDFARQWLSR